MSAPRLTGFVLVVLALVELGASAPASAQRLEWHGDWRRANAVDGVLVGAGLVGSLVLMLAVDDSRPGWDGIGPVDGAGRGLSAAAERARRRADRASDVLLGVNLTLGPVILEPIVAWADHNDVAGQLALMSLRSFALASLALTALKYGLRRRRPPCAEDGEPCVHHGRNRSFPSGHAALAFTAASLSCTTHQRTPLYPSRAAGVAACAGAIAVATTTSLLRLVSRRHHVSDVVVGVLLGVAAGWLLPALATFGGLGGTRHRPEG